MQIITFYIKKSSVKVSVQFNKEKKKKKWIKRLKKQKLKKVKNIFLNLLHASVPKTNISIVS